MPAYQIYRLRESQRQHFRWAPHTAGITTVKQKDYESGPLIEAPGVYAAWEHLRGTEHPLQVGDILEVNGETSGGESNGGVLRIYKYVGFEEARWFVPEPAAPVAPAEGSYTAVP